MRVDPRTSQVAGRLDIGNRPQGIGVSEGEALVSIGESDAAHRGGALIVRNPAIVESIDTALADSTTEWMLLRMTNDGLVAFNETSGLAGAQLVPDLAVSLPTPTNDGKTYVFHLDRASATRPGNGQAVRRPRHLRARLRSRWCPIRRRHRRRVPLHERPRRCDLSDGIVPNDAARTVTFHLVAADPNFLYKLALPNAFVLPAGTPLRDSGTHPLPATGPYVIASYRPQHSLRFVRNTSFHEWSKAAQPDGYPNQILFEMVDSPDQAVKDVIEGRADAFGSIGGLPSQDLLEQLQTRFADRVRSNPYQRVFALFLNTRVRPFDSLDARRALNYAADRAAAVSVAGGPDAAQATCQILPPDFPGYRPYCPYSKGASTDGRWKAPDLARARALVNASGTRGMKVTFWSWAPAADFGVYAVKLLRSLGYRASLKVLSRTGYFSVANDPRTRAQIGFMPWTSDYPAPSGFFDPLLTCASRVQGPGNANAAGFCDPRIDREISDAIDHTDQESRRRARPVGAHRPTDGRRGAVGAARQPEDRQRALQAGRQLPVQPDVVDAHRPALGPVGGAVTRGFSGADPREALTSPLDPAPPGTASVQDMGDPHMPFEAQGSACRGRFRRHHAERRMDRVATRESLHVTWQGGEREFVIGLGR